MDIESRPNNENLVPSGKVGSKSDGFAMYYNEALIDRTPYNGDSEYFRRAEARIDHTYSLIAKFIPGSSMLDIGASPFYLLYKALKGGAANAQGIFFSHDEHPLRDQQEIYCRYGSIGLKHSNVEKDLLPFEDNSFDIVTACEILEHFDYFPELLCSEIRRVLRPGGVVCLTVPNVSSVTNILNLIFQKNIFSKYRRDSSGRHKHEYTYAQLKDLTEYMGFDIISSGSLPFSTGRRKLVKALYRIIHVLPVLKGYSPVLYVVARQSDAQPRARNNAPPQSMYSDALSIEV